MADIKQVADAADMIVNGYAFTRCTEGYRVLNLNRPDRAAVFSKDGKVLETSMDDIEVRLLEIIWRRTVSLWRIKMPVL